MTQILICDDEQSRSQRMADNLTRTLSVNGSVGVNALTPREFVEAISGLEQRQKKARSDPAECTTEAIDLGKSAEDGGHPFDSADILFLDYDLVHLADEDGYAGGSESGERLAYLSRCYSRCGTIVAYNQFFYGRTFDLTLRGHLRSFADLNLASDSISNPGLWSDDYEGFRPWSWPILLDSPNRLQRCTEFLASNVDRPILDLLELNRSSVYSALTRELLEFLSVTGPPESAQIDQFVRDSGNCLRIKDRLWEPSAALRIASARIAKWLERAVLPGQNILVDAPHLIDRFPSLVDGDASEASWNRSCALGSPVGDLGIKIALIEPAQFPAPDWLSRKAWIWPLLARDEAIREVSDPWATSEESLAFCEDASRFHRHDLVREFVAEVNSEFARRYVRAFPDVTYEPISRFLM
jgi:hypothetical protein